MRVGHTDTQLGKEGQVIKVTELWSCWKRPNGKSVYNCKKYVHNHKSGLIFVKVYTDLYEIHLDLNLNFQI